MIPRTNPSDRSTSTASVSGWEVPGYGLMTEIAAGGMATVYLARERSHGALGRMVAIKKCHPHLRHDPTFVSMFLDEARLASLIRHPNVVETIDIGDPERLYFVMEYVEGASLSDWLVSMGNSRQNVDIALLLRVVVDCLNGLGAAHNVTDSEGRGLHLVHRDISPQNILIGVNGVAKISDFGIAKAEARATRTRTGQVKGKTGYMSPEQILAESVDLRSDLYAVGVVLWEALTGRRLFEGDSDAAIINQVMRGQLSAPSTLTGADHALDAVVLRALAFRPTDRYSTASEFAAAIEAAGPRIANTEEVAVAISRQFGSLLRARRNAEIAEASDPSQLKPVGAALSSFWGVLPFNRITRRSLTVIAILLMMLVFWLQRRRFEVRLPVAPTSPSLGRPATVNSEANPQRAMWSSGEPDPGVATRISPSTVPPTRRFRAAQVEGSAASHRIAPPPKISQSAPQSTRPIRPKPSEYRPPDL